ncbi:MAG: di-trans,poly-cis-decaprenylcistransferase [Clostridia bacterium]|nr:di-trans,poly-cis-decaprenylcistransferase [Clostridia bacterium]
MDGNGRWAKKRSLPRSAGHAAGTEALREIIRACDEFKIEIMSIYAFSTENWNRPADEVQTLMKLITKYFLSEIDELMEKGVRIRILGDLDAFPDEQRQALITAQERTKDNKGLKLNIALNYGGRMEIIRAARALSEKCVKGEMKPDDISVETFSLETYTKDDKDVDLLIRTSGEKRLSNFLLWQTWYAEIIFSPVYWPDYNRDELIKDLHEYASRDRRFGKVKDK